MSGHTRASEEERFSKNAEDLSIFVLQLVEELREQSHSVGSPEIIKLAGCLISSFDKVVLIQGFIRRSHTTWNNIHKRDISFFIEEASTIFGELPIDKVDAFKTIFTLKKEDGGPIISEEDENILWDYFSAMVKICINYLHRNRKPYMRRSGDDVLRGYHTPGFMDDVAIDLVGEAEKWKMTLNFPLVE